MRRSVLTIVAVAALVIALPAPAGAATVQNLSAPGSGGVWPQVAVDAAGNAVAVWVRFDGANTRVQIRARSAAGVLSQAQTLSASGFNAFDPHVGVDATGDAVVVWARFDGSFMRVQARTRSAAGVLGPVRTLSKAGQNAAQPRVAVDDAGNAWIVWVRSDGAYIRLQGVGLSSTGALGTVENLSSQGYNVIALDVAVSAVGDGRVVFLDSRNHVVRTRFRSAAGVLGSGKVLSSLGQPADDPHIAMADNGDGLAVWERSDGTNERIEARLVVGTGGGNRPVETLSAAGRDAGDPAVAMNGAGEAVVAWQRSHGLRTRAEVVFRSATGVLAPPQTLSASGQNASNPDVGIDTDGDAAVVWERFDGLHTRIQTASRAADGTLTAVRTLSKAGQDAVLPRVAVDADGDGLAVWQRFDGANFRIQGAPVSA